MNRDIPDNYYAILGVPVDANSETLKRAYRQLARRYHPDLAGPEGAVQMKRINRAYDVLSDPEKRLNYDTIIGGVIDLRKGGLVRPRPVQRKFADTDDLEFSGLSIFSTKGPWKTGPTLRSILGVISSLASASTTEGLLIAAGSLDGKGLIWYPETPHEEIQFVSDPGFTVESLRELRLSSSGGLLAGWGRLGVHVWDTQNGSLLWSYPLLQRAVSAHYSLDLVLLENLDQKREVLMAFPLLKEDPLAPRAWGVRGTDVVSHILDNTSESLSTPLACAEDEIERRQFWAIRLRTLAQDGRTLLTLSCAAVPGEFQQMIVIRRWDLTSKTRFGNKFRPQITVSILAGSCDDCAPPYTVTPDASTLAYVHTGQKVRVYDTNAGTYNEIASGTIGGSARLALSPDALWLAIAREDSEINEGVIDLWSVSTGQLVQKLYHPWQISALHFANKQLIVALTDGTIQVWQ